MGVDADVRLAAYRDLYAAVAATEEKPASCVRPFSLAALDRALAARSAEWLPSPTACASWAEYAARLAALDETQSTFSEAAE